MLLSFIWEKTQTLIFFEDDFNISRFYVINAIDNRQVLQCSMVLVRYHRIVQSTYTTNKAL